MYLVETRHELALRYNDKSVLENHHIASAFALLHSTDHQLNIFENLLPEEYKKMREMLITLVLNTDMSNHFGDLGKFKGRL